MNCFHHFDSLKSNFGPISDLTLLSFFKAFAIGLVFVFTRLFAWIPSPVYVGWVIDTACLLSSSQSGSMDCKVSNAVYDYKSVKRIKLHV